MPIEQFRPSSGFKLLPEVVKNLLIINGIFFLATYVLETRGFDLGDILGLHYFASDKFRPYQIITYMFMHGGLMHIAFNMFALWMFGVPVENVWGPRKFLTFYLFTGIGAAITHYAIVYFEMQPITDAINGYITHPGHTVDELQSLMNSDVFSKFSSSELNQSKAVFTEKFNSLLQSNPQEAFDYSVQYLATVKGEILNAPVIVGASGAVFGVLLAFGMLFPNTILYLYFMIPIKSKYAVILFGLIELFSGVLSVPGDNVAHFAHLGGLLFGVILIFYWRNQNRRRNNFYN